MQNSMLCLLLPHRCKADLLSTGAERYKYTHKLQEVYQRDQGRIQNGLNPVVFTTINENLLQNIQNARSNSLRYKVGEDDLTRNTEEYKSPNGSAGSGDDDEEEEEQNEATYEDFLAMIEAEEDENINQAFDDDPEFFKASMNGFKMDAIRNQGKDSCGWNRDIPTPAYVEPEQGTFLNCDLQLESEELEPNVPRDQDRRFYSASDLVKLHMIRNSPKVSKKVWQDKHIEASDATGTIKSIREWAKASFREDKCQIRAFEVIISSFLLTFYEETAEDARDATMTSDEARSRYRVMKNKLKRLRGIDKGEANLIMLLHDNNSRFIELKLQS